MSNLDSRDDVIKAVRDYYAGGMRDYWLEKTNADIQERFDKNFQVSVADTEAYDLWDKDALEEAYQTIETFVDVEMGWLESQGYDPEQWGTIYENLKTEPQLYIDLMEIEPGGELPLALDLNFSAFGVDSVAEAVKLYRKTLV